MKKQVKTLTAILLLICSLSIYITFSQNKQNQVSSNQKATQITNMANKKEINPTTNVSLDIPDSAKAKQIENKIETEVAPNTVATVENKTNTNENPPIQITADEAAASQQDPVTIDLAYQGNWKSLDGTKLITGNQYGFKIEGSPVGWLVRYSKNDTGLILGDTNYFTYYARLTENDHLIIEKTDGTESLEFRVV